MCGFAFGSHISSLSQRNFIAILSWISHFPNIFNGLLALAAWLAATTATINRRRPAFLLVLIACKWHYSRILWNNKLENGPKVVVVVIDKLDVPPSVRLWFDGEFRTYMPYLIHNRLSGPDAKCDRPTTECRRHKTMECLLHFQWCPLKMQYNSARAWTWQSSLRMLTSPIFHVPSRCIRTRTR